MGKGAQLTPICTVSQQKKTPLWTACIHGYLDIVDLLLYKKAQCNLHGEDGHLLNQAHMKGQHEVARLLLEYGADPKALTGVDLDQACHLGYAERALSISHDASIEDLKKCIAVACEAGYPETAMRIIITIDDQYRQKECYKTYQQYHHAPQSLHSD